MDMKNTIAKYGLIPILCIILCIIGIALYVWKKDESGEDAKEIKTAGLAIAIVGAIISIGAIAYTVYSTSDTQSGGGSSSTTGGNGGEDVAPED